jgi:hypothetical protein
MTKTLRIRAISTPGHTAGHMSLWVELPKGSSVILCGDAADLSENLKQEIAPGLCRQDRDDLALESNQKIPDGMNLPEEIARREDRLKAIAEAKLKIESRARERFEQEQADYQAKVDKRETKSNESGKSPRGRAPVAPVEGAQDKDQINLTAEESCIMKTAGGGFD